MKRVLPEIAKYLKSIGFPQNNLKDNIYISEPNAPFIEVAYQPTYIEVWLWLCRDSKILSVEYDVLGRVWNVKTPANLILGQADEPEHAIEKAICSYINMKLKDE